jgi:quinol monooxygenase YgiN
MIHVIASITVKPGARDAYVAEFKKLVPLVLAEKGCITYGPTLDIATDIAAQAKVEPNVVTIIEQWSNVDALKAHLAAPHMAEFRAKNGHMVESLVLKIHQPA